MQITEASAADSTRCAEIQRAARARMRYLPSLHTPEEDRIWMKSVVFARGRVWVAQCERRVVGFAALVEGMLVALYVEPDSQRHGAGSALLQRAKAASPEGFALWVFQPNHGAIRFYERHGFKTVRETGGSGNEERVPDRLMRWQPDRP